jgi:hypothetical protein
MMRMSMVRLFLPHDLRLLSQSLENPYSPMQCYSMFISYADFQDDKRGKTLLKTTLYDSLKAWRPATDHKRTLEVGCPSIKCITRQPAHFPAASCFPATTTKQKAYWHPT